ncbi:MAG: class I mannose-6-phosphate isomerase [Oscillospiraceae bacterium]|nr:class I mannose-6-phosphate isomerase [Oscillospiraceae bacterium]
MICPPFKLSPVFKDYIWGGDRLKTDYGKNSELSRIAESWELSCHPDGESVIADGEFKGKTLTEFLKDQKQPPVSVLIKLIDAADNLSIQVHPNDEYAKKEGDNGKTEMWYIIEHEPGAELIYGFNCNITREEFKARVVNGTLLDVMNRVKVKKGDVFFIPAGTLHAIGKGILIAEVQQSSNLTYRVYDYGRTDADGNPRDLHIEKALEVTETAPPLKPYDRTECEYFRFETLETKGESLYDTKGLWSAVLVLDGEVKLGGVVLKKGETGFVPAGHDKICLKGCGKLITVHE